MSGISKRVSGSWVSGDYGIMKTATDTLTTLPAVLYPNDTTATVGLKGQMQQTGSPTPQNPIQPSECGDRTGNLAYDRIDDANIDSLGTITRFSGYDIAIGRVESGVTYTTNSYVLAFYTNEPTIGSVSYDGSRIVSVPETPTTFTAPITGYVAFRLNSGEQAMLNLGSTALPYEPYGYKIPISSASTTTPVYLGEVETTRKIKKLVLTGDELITYNTKNDLNKRFAVTVPLQLSGTSVPDNVISTHLKPLNSISVILLQTGICMRANANDIVIAMSYDEVGITSPTDATTIETAVKSYLAAQYANGTPVCVWYVLETETTGIVNEPIRKIGDYADTVSGITIPTIAGANTLSVDTTLQPSEVTVNYHGWHPVQSVHEYDSNYTIATMQALTIAQLQSHTIGDLEGGEWA